MEFIFLLLIFAQLSIQLPHPALSLPFVPRAHSISPYTSNLKRVSYHSSQRLRERQSSGSIVDNERTKFLLPITVGDQTLDAELDTGSSDTWLIQSGFQCWQTFDTSSQKFVTSKDTSYCNFGDSYTPDAAFTPISAIYELSCYGQTGENSERCVSGSLGTASVTFAGLTVTEQVIGAPNQSSYFAVGLQEQSGIIGMAFSALTNAVNSTTNARVPYNSIMETVFNVDSFDPPLAKQFSLAISRDTSGTGNGGILTIGGVPSLTDPAVNVSSDTYTSAAFQLVPTFSATEYSFYSILVDGFVLGESSTDAGTQVIIDSGANTIQVPSDTADAINAAWSPAVNSDGSLDCNAVLTEPFGIAIGGATYYISSVDLIRENAGSCSSLVSAGSSGDLLIGDPLLKNVLAVYNWQDAVMSFYPRVYYNS